LKSDEDIETMSGKELFVAMVFSKVDTVHLLATVDITYSKTGGDHKTMQIKRDNEEEVVLKIIEKGKTKLFFEIE